MSLESQVVRRIAGPLSLPDGGSSDAMAEPSAAEVGAVLSGPPWPAILDARSYLVEAGRRFEARLDNGHRVRPLDSLRLEATRLLAGRTAEHGDLEDLYVLTDHGGCDLLDLARAVRPEDGPAAFVSIETSDDGSLLLTRVDEADGLGQGRPA